jgi:hypothetical protein
VKDEEEVISYRSHSSKQIAAEVHHRCFHCNNPSFTMVTDINSEAIATIAVATLALVFLNSIDCLEALGIVLALGSAITPYHWQYIHFSLSAYKKQEGRD